MKATRVSEYANCVVDAELPRGPALYRPPKDKALARRFYLPDEERLVVVEEDSLTWLEKKPFLLPALWCKFEWCPESGNWHYRVLPLRCLVPLPQAEARSEEQAC